MFARSRNNANPIAIESAPPEQPNRTVCTPSPRNGFSAFRTSQRFAVLAVSIPTRLDPTPVWH